jgi:hypothetical protein
MLNVMIAILLLVALTPLHGAETLSNRAVRCELAVIGGGSGGFGAALAAARAGVDVVLVERADCLGGNSVRGGVHCWEPGAGGTGFPFELYQRLKKVTNAVGIYSMGRHQSTFDPRKEAFRFPGGEAVVDPTKSYLDTLARAGTRQRHGVLFEPEALSKAMLTLLEETGHCRVFFGAEFASVTADRSRVSSVRLADGRRIEADYFVDATGDGLVCTAAGCQAMTGQESREAFGEPDAPTNATSRINGVTLIYRVSPATEPNIEPLPQGISNLCWWAKNFPVAVFNHYPNGDLNVNMLPTMDGAEFMRLGYREAMEECSKRTLAHWHDLQTRFKEFSRFKLVWTAPALGIRETQRIVGDNVLTEHDLRAGISGQKHDDIICLADHAMDTHGSHNKGIGELKEPYGVPYRCLIPKGRRNLLIACRAASFSSLAASSCRLSRTMMQLGQAAGTAVALAKQLNVELPDVPPGQLRVALRKQHVQLDSPLPDELREYIKAEKTLQ